MDSYQSERWETFSNYPYKSSVSRLFDAGFMYQAHNDEVVCPQCNMRFKSNDWQRCESPFMEHMRNSPNCPFLQNHRQQRNNEMHMDTENTYNSVTQNLSHLNLNTNKYQEQSLPPENNSVSMISGGPVCQPSDNDQIAQYKPSLTHKDTSWQSNWKDSVLHESTLLHQDSLAQSQLKDRVSEEPISGSSRISDNSIVKKKPVLLENNIPRPNSINHINAQPHTCNYEITSNNVYLQREGANNLVRTDQNDIEHRLSLNLNTSLPQANFQHIDRTSIPQSDAAQFIYPPQIRSLQQRQQQLPYQVNQNTGNQHTSQQLSNIPNTQRVNVTSNEEAMRLLSNTSQGQEQWLKPRAPVLNQFAQVDYTIKNNRIQSFQGRWPEGHFLTPEELAEAGLYYTGPNDRTQCAWCRGGLLNWEPTDTALGEHQRHFPECIFVRQKVASILSGRPVPGLPLVSDTGLGQDEIVRTNIQPQPYEVFQRNNPPVFNPPPPPPQASLFDRNPVEEAKEAVKGMGFGADIINFAIEQLHITGVYEINSEILLNKILEINEQPVDTLPANAVQSLSNNTTESNNSNNDVTDTPQPRCKVCLDEAVEVLFLPCRHIVCCEGCSLRVDTCPFCRVCIAGTVKAFIP